VANRYKHTQFIEDTRFFDLPDDGSFTQAHDKRQRSFLMKKNHPDRGGSTEKAQQISATFERLSAWIKAERRRTALGLLLLVGSGGYLAVRRRADFRSKPPS
jgi:hypothetical protein